MPVRGSPKCKFSPVPPNPINVGKYSLDRDWETVAGRYLLTLNFYHWTDDGSLEGAPPEAAPQKLINNCQLNPSTDVNEPFKLHSHDNGLTYPGPATTTRVIGTGNDFDASVDLPNSGGTWNSFSLNNITSSPGDIEAPRVQALQSITIDFDAGDSNPNGQIMQFKFSAPFPSAVVKQSGFMSAA